jgi:DNA-binding transcriptional regulator YdaS (Cro superfamily)
LTKISVICYKAVCNVNPRLEDMSTTPSEVRNPELQRAVDICGGQTALANAIGKKGQNIQYWLKNVTPGDYVLKIEAAVAAKAEERGTNELVTRHDLRPDLYPIEKAA